MSGGTESAGSRLSLLPHANVESPITHFSFSEFILNPLPITLVIIINMKANWTRNCLLMVTEELSSSFMCEHECLGRSMVLSGNESVYILSSTSFNFYGVIHDVTLVEVGASSPFELSFFLLFPVF